jgi:hypothetical protein
LSNDLLLNLVDFFGSFINHFITFLLIFLHLERPLVYILITLLVGFSRVMQIEHFEDILVGSRENLFIWPHFQSLRNELLGNCKLLK